MRVLSSKYESRGDAEPIVGPAVQAAELIAAQLDTVAAAAKKCDAPAATGGGWR